MLRPILQVGCLLCLTFGLGASLDCWFCVGPDCDGPMSGSKFSYTKTCDPGAVCQKTIYYINDLALNVTNATVPIRSCSWNYGCTPNDDFQSPNTSYCGYGWKTQQGCQKRWCCATDLCNSSTTISPLALWGLAVISSASWTFGRL